MKIKRLLLILLVSGIGLAAAAIAMVDTLAKSGIEAGGTYALGVPTQLESAKIGLFSGEFGLNGLSVANPKGFEGKHILKLNEGGLALSLSSLFEEVIVAPKLELTGIAMLMQKGSGGFNYEVLLDNLERFESKEPDQEPADAPEEPGTKKTFLFQEIILRDITTSLDLFGEGAISTATITIPEVVINDLGSEPKTLSEVFQIIFETILESSIEFGADLMPAQLAQQVEARLEGAKLDLYDKADDALDDLTDKLGPQAGQALEGLLDQAKNEIDKGLEKGMRDLFGKKKKKN